MRTLARAVLVAIVAALAAMLVPSAAGAATGDCTGADGYAPGTGCSVSVALDPVCTDDLEGALDYAVTTAGVQSSTYTATLTSGSGTVTTTGLPASGVLAWPAGWSSATVTFVPDSAPSLSVSSTHDAPVCVSQVLADGGTTTTTTPSTVSAVLAATGLDAGALVALAAGLLVVGAGTVVLVSRRRHAQA